MKNLNLQKIIVWVTFGMAVLGFALNEGNKLGLFDKKESLPESEPEKTEE